MSDITINDVAKRAGVSKATVSRVISNSSKVSKKTREIVEKVVSDLNYIPNSAAQNLSQNNSRIIGIVLNSEDLNPLLNNTFFSTAINAISEFLIENKYYTIYIHCNNSKKEKEYIDFLVKSRRVDGLIFLRNYDDESIFNYLEEISFPFSIIGKPNHAEKYLWVDNDNIKSAYDVTKKMIEQNRKNFIFIGGSMKLNVTKNRYTGFINALDEYNIKFNKEYLINAKFNEKDAYNKLLNIVKQNNIDAIFTTDDIFAIAATKAIESINRTDIKVSGYNNSFLRKYVEKDFLTVDINVEKLAIEASKLVLKKVKKEKIEINYSIVKSKLIEK
ncbi:LacI family DNA-binding transcriptional regulator [Oceanivirga miroungae]|uniref:Sugar-binding transcriptional regulator, LacI family n=1 Tax=Oceanivirga miroungae TaxID=1130046 RepID=A0A6I8MA33_9FUSO|nr:LacI family DNA-binding transcriptional regulator [Oceanivirga miroungae]VWL85177.1 sugar-binding transcriptional regulator, LacI family [Oceanivirga miroungae]